jgi:MYXO-CTERM domain-containing protein
MTKRWFNRLTTLCLTLAVCLVPVAALAAGQVKWKSTRLPESGGSWKIDVEMHMPKPPDMAHIPMRFSFKPVVYYERTLVDGQDGPVLRKVPLENRQPIVESVDVGFMDAGRGEIQKRTKFSFRITRAHNFEAGEYEVTIRDSRTDGQIGTTTRLVLEGENEVIDRRAMVFSGEKKKKKDEEDKPAGGDDERPQKRELDPEDDAYWAGGPTEPSDNGPPPIEEKPGGCGCRVGGRAPTPGLFGLLGLALVLGLRRRH